MLAIFEKEIKSMFHSMTAYLYLALFLSATAVYFSYYCLSYGLAEFGSRVLSSITILFIIIVPILTMRTFAEEKKQKTDQLLLTSPLSIKSIVFGKYMAVLALFAIGLCGAFFDVVLLSSFGTVDWKSEITVFIGFFLMGACFLAIGLFISAQCESSVVAAAISFGVVLACFLLPGIASMAPGRARYTFVVCGIAIILLAVYLYQVTKNWICPVSAAVIVLGILTGLYVWKKSLFDDGISQIISWFSVLDRFDHFINGIFDASSIIYYISFIAVFLFLTGQTIEKRRWS